MTLPEQPHQVPNRDAEALQRALKLVRLIRDPSLPGVVFHVVLAVAGAIGVVVAALSVAGMHFVSLQLPHVISGGFGGAALLASGALLAAVQAERADRARARHQMQHIMDRVAALAQAIARTRFGREL